MHTARDFLGKGLAALAVTLVSVRVAFWARRLPVHQLPDRLRQVPRLPLSWRSPERFAWACRRFCAHLPPSDFGPCLRRSLLLVDLMARCGIAATVHCGVRKSSGGLEGHAWVSAADGALPDPETVPPDFREVWAA